MWTGKGSAAMLSAIFGGAYVVALLLGQTGTPLTLQELAAKAKPSVVHLDILGSSGNRLGSGSGFFVTSNGLIATNNHVIESAAAVIATLWDGSQVKVKGIAAQSTDKDLALIKAEVSNSLPLRLGNSEKLKQGDEVVVIGSPGGHGGTLTSGIVSALRAKGISELRQITPGRLIQITAPISPGSSGSPVLAGDGSVVGIATFLLRDAQNLNFAMPVEPLDDLLERSMVNPGNIRPFRRIPWNNLFISVLFFAAVSAGAFAIRKKTHSRASKGYN